MKPCISVIVPVYNGELYLSQCVDSILGQELTELELILVNDGSKDNSGAICDEYARQDNRVRVLHLQNQGVSNARNAGMEIALGEYITFVDADDWVDGEMYSEMLAMIIHHRADIGMCSFTVFDGSVHRDNILPWAHNTVFEGEEIKAKLISALISSIGLDGNKQPKVSGTVFRCIFNRDLIQSNQSYFDTRIKNAEDLVFVVQVFSQTDRIVVSKRTYYHYRQDTRYKRSTTQNYIQELYYQKQLSQKVLADILDGIGYLEHMQKQLQWRNCNSLLNCTRNICLPTSPIIWSERVKMIKHFIADSKFKLNVDQVGYTYFRPDHRILLLLLRYSFIRTAMLAYTIRHRLW